MFEVLLAGGTPEVHGNFGGDTELDDDCGSASQASTLERGAQSPVPSDVSGVAASAGDAAGAEFFQKFCHADGSIDMGNFISNMASHYVSNAHGSDCTIGEPSTLPRRLSVSSACSGSGAGELTFEGGVHAISNEFMIPLEVEVPFMCEKEKWKQRYLLDNILKPESDTCLFDCVVKLGNLSKDNPGEPTHKCVRHNAPCCPRRKPTFMFKSGFSCKGDSKANVRFAEYRMSMKNKDFTNPSVATFFGTLGVISYIMPQCVVLENVDSIGDESAPDSNLQLVVQELEQLSTVVYKVKVFNTITSDYFLPQTRTLLGRAHINMKLAIFRVSVSSSKVCPSLSL